ncbi:MAG TPA: amidohydrolase family protein [Gammaproteobacteria bacterium]
MKDVLIVRGGWVFAGAGNDIETIRDGAVAISGELISDIGSWTDVSARHPGARVMGSERNAVIPGLINAHHHSHGISSIQHGIPDLHLEPWILAWRQMRSVDPYLDTLLSAAAQLRTGVTAVIDVHNGGGNATRYAQTARQKLRAHADAGLRVAFAAGLSTQSFLVAGGGEDKRFIDSLPQDLKPLAKPLLPPDDRISVDEYFEVLGTLRQEAEADPRSEIWFGPPGPQWVSDDFLQRIAERAEQWSTGVQTHVNESFYEKLHGPRAYGQSTVIHLRDLGVLSPRFSIAHGVWLNAEEIEAMAESGAAVSHNPSSNLRLRAGVAPWNALRSAGVTVGIGMDATTLNADEDMFTEMRLALRLARPPMLGQPAPSPRDVFAAATAGGARILSRDNDLGRIAAGFQADLVLVDLERIDWPWVAPETDPLELTLLRAGAGDVTDVLIAGELVYRDGKPTRFDLAAAGRELGDQLARTPLPSAEADRVARLLPYLEAWYESWEIPELEPWTAFNSKR